MAALIVVIDGQEIEHGLIQGQTLIGRHPDCGLVVSQPSVSGRHAAIHEEGGDFWLEDVGSRNGTFVNQKRIEGRVKLRHDDALRFGDAVARFHDPAAVPAAPVLPPSPKPAKSVQATLELSPGQVDIDEAGEANITEKVGLIGRFGGLDVNPEAKLKAVLEISKNLAGTVDLNTLLPKILDTLFTIFRYADRGCILLKDESTGKMVPRAMRHRRQNEDSTVRLSRTIVDKVLAEKTGILSADASMDAAFGGSQSITDINIRSMMCVPLLGLDDDVLGILSIDSQNTLGQFSRDDLDILMTVAGQAALSYENARLVQVYAEKQKQDAELDIAKTVQRGLLPTTMPKVEGYQFFASYDSARAVGGDIYDWYDLPDGKICLSFGDVAGKGVPGALIMSRMDSCVQSTLRHVHDVVEAIGAINDHMCDSGVEGRFVTYVLCIVDTKNHEVVLANAGHMPPIIRRANGTIERFDEELSGPPICVVDGYPYEAQSCQLEPGDLILMYTDGVDEAMNPDGELYGIDRVLEVVKQGPADAEQLGKRLLADVRRHARGYPQSDDITIMTFGRSV
ncbi:MAG: SpoIIE family protein phosphatase [Candidatus Anammoximicrobium sp.]|nr:SpoIIE family protein phosphatase [Candidatus Anammoximicrobium sp.]